jgi:mono/diheme cytochrome c family protein
MPLFNRRHAPRLVLGICLAAAGLAVVTATADTSAAPTAADTISAAEAPGMLGDPVAQPVSTPANPQLVQRGEYLAVAGDCQYCHSVPGGAAYAGGQPVQTPFGDLFTPNITPDKQFGIGNWTDAQFWNVMHNGIGPGHSLLVFPNYLYPVMPWQDYNKLSYPDVMAIKAYLDSLQPVAAPNRPSEMSFPFTLRAGLLAWRILFFHDQPIAYDPSWSPQVRNGAFLVQALAHCNECHAQRNLLMAVEPSKYLAGGHLLAQSWVAPNISSDKQAGVGGWSANDLFTYLYRDGALGTGAPIGPMKAVVDDSLSHLPASDVQDIVAYLQTATPDQHADPAAVTQGVGNGAALYADNCARCHGANGEGVTNNFPNLAGNQSVWGTAPDNDISMILGGYQPWHSNQSAMPEFNQHLSDAQIADVVNYIRTAWGNQGQSNATAAEVADARSLASDWVMLSTGTMQASVNGASFDDISGQLELFGDRENCMMNATFTAAGQPPIYLAGSCADGNRFKGELVTGGQSQPAELRLYENGSGARLTALLLYGKLPGGGDFRARIALASPAD